MDTEIVEFILRNRREQKLMSKEEIKEEIKLKVVDIYGEFIDFEKNKDNVYETLNKLDNYKYCNSIDDLKKGIYVRFINTKYFYDIKLNIGGFIENIENDLISIINNNKYYKIRYSDNNFFIKLTDEDTLKLEIIDLLEKN